MNTARRFQGIITLGLLTTVAVTYGSTAADSETGTYSFLPEQSTVVQTGGIAGVHWTYSIEGQLQLTVDRDAGTASFARVDAHATDDGPPHRALDPNDVFSLTSLSGRVVDGTTLSFTGKAPDGSDVHLTAILQDNLAHLTGQTTPPPNSADFFVFSLDAVAQRKYSGGTGEPNDPYQIATAADLIALGETPEDYDKHFVLTADIDLDPNLPGCRVFDGAVIAPDVNDENSWHDGASFTGVLDGNGHTVSHLKVEGVGYLGLFGHLGGSAEVGNLSLTDINLTGSGDHVGGLAGRSWGDGKMSHCYVIGNVSGRSYVGGLIGSHDAIMISRCYAAGNVRGSEEVGGVVGRHTSGYLYDSGSSAAVSGNIEVGGLVGRAEWGGRILGSCAAGAVHGRSKVGGLIGYCAADVLRDCYVRGTVTGTECVGGLVGNASAYSPITNCYSAVVLETDSPSTYGLIGMAHYGSEIEITGSFYDADVSGITWSHFPVPYSEHKRTTTEMQDPNTFRAAGWDFVGLEDGPNDMWAEPEGGGYPILFWQIPPQAGLPVFSGGTGEPNDPYVISTSEELNSIGANPRLMQAHFKLIKDIDLTGVNLHMIGDRWRSYGGVFNGDGHCIANFSHDYADNSSYGCVFGSVSGIFARAGVEICNLGLRDPNIVIQNGTTGLVGSLGWGGSVVNCYCDRARIVGGNAGLVAYNSGLIANCYWTGSLISESHSAAGGLVAENYGTTTNCYTQGSVTGVGPGTSSGSRTRGLSLSGTDAVGGLVGYNSGRIVMSYSAVQVTNGAGLVGAHGAYSAYRDAGIFSCFWDIEVSGQSQSTWNTVIGKTTADMQKSATFLGADVGWDFVGETDNGTEGIWWIDEGWSYPRLAWERGQAHMRQPSADAIDVTQPVILRWTRGGLGLLHDVYLGQDKDVVAGALPETLGVYRGRQSTEIVAYDTGILDPSKSYYWRIDEVDDTDPDKVWKGDVWGFTVADFATVKVIDDFECSLDSSLYGANVIPPEWNEVNAHLSVEYVMVHSGAQSMRIVPAPGWGGYMPTYAGAVRTWDTPQDWKNGEADSLTLYFMGHPDNRAYPLHLRISDGVSTTIGSPESDPTAPRRRSLFALAAPTMHTAVVVCPDSDAMRATGWQKWQITLTDIEAAGVNLSAVEKIQIGVGDPDQPVSAGIRFRLYIDDILLTRRMP